MWSIWNVQPQLTDAMQKLSYAPNDIQEDVMHTIWKIVILFNHTTSKSMYEHRQVSLKTSAYQPDVKQIPPTKGALQQHLKRVTYQGGYC